MMTPEEFDNAVANWKKHFVEDARSDLKEALAQVEALKAENARLQNTVYQIAFNAPSDIEKLPEMSELSMRIAFRRAVLIAREALQPAPGEVKNRD